MKHMKIVHIPAKEVQDVDKISCDLCGAEIKPKRYDAEQVTINYRSGYECPDGGSGEETEVDMCSNCFKEKLIPWFKEQGATIRTTDWSW